MSTERPIRVRVGRRRTSAPHKKRVTHVPDRGVQPEAVPDYERPRTRGECPVERPCPYAGCRYHLYTEVTDCGSLVIFKHLEVWEMDETCALDVAERGGRTLEEVGLVMGLTRERVRQIELDALARVKAALTEIGLDEDDVASWLDALQPHPGEAPPAQVQAERREVAAHQRIFEGDEEARTRRVVEGSTAWSEGAQIEVKPSPKLR